MSFYRCAPKQVSVAMEWLPLGLQEQAGVGPVTAVAAQGSAAPSAGV